MGPELYPVTFSPWGGPSDTTFSCDVLRLRLEEAVQPCGRGRGLRLSGAGIPRCTREGVSSVAAPRPCVYLTARFRFTQRRPTRRGARGGGPKRWLPSKGSVGRALGMQGLAAVPRLASTAYMNAALLHPDSLGGSRSGFLHAGLHVAPSRESLGSGGPVSRGHLCKINTAPRGAPQPGPQAPLLGGACPKPCPSALGQVGGPFAWR